MSIERFVRFADKSGKIVYGEPAASQLSDRLEGVEVAVLSGDPFTGLSKTGTRAIISKVSSALFIGQPFLSKALSVS